VNRLAAYRRSVPARAEDVAHLSFSERLGRRQTGTHRPSQSPRCREPRSSEQNYSSRCCHWRLLCHGPLDSLDRHHVGEFMRIGNVNSPSTCRRSAAWQVEGGDMVVAYPFPAYQSTDPCRCGCHRHVPRASTYRSHVQDLASSLFMSVNDRKVLVDDLTVVWFEQARLDGVYQAKPANSQHMGIRAGEVSGSGTAFRLQPSRSPGTGERMTRSPDDQMAKAGDHGRKKKGEQKNRRFRHTSSPLCFAHVGRIDRVMVSAPTATSFEKVDHLGY
jgi:hypothetical protein